MGGWPRRVELLLAERAAADFALGTRPRVAKVEVRCLVGKVDTVTESRLGTGHHGQGRAAGVDEGPARLALLAIPLWPLGGASAGGPRRRLPGKQRGVACSSSSATTRPRQLRKAFAGGAGIAVARVNWPSRAERAQGRRALTEARAAAVLVPSAPQPHS